MELPTLSIGNLIAQLPIVQGGMSVGVSMSGLASAVANQGGIGVIGAAGLGFAEPDFDSNPFEANMRALKNEIRKAKSMSDGIIGVNILKALSDFDNLLKTAIREEVDAVFIGAGLPLRVPNDIGLDLFREMKTKIIPVVSSKLAVERLFEFWSKNFNAIPDAIVVEGPKAGGHLGFTMNDLENGTYNLTSIIKEIRQVIDRFAEQFKKTVSLIAAGGIFTGKDIFDAMKNGADGVQMGTRFVGTDECDASDEFKKAYINSKKEDIVLIHSPVGMPGRAINNDFLRSVESGSLHDTKCNWRCLRTCRMQKAQYCIGRALLNAKNGHLDKGFAFAGSNAYRVKEIIPVAALVETLKREYESAKGKMPV